MILVEFRQFNSDVTLSNAIPLLPQYQDVAVGINENEMFSTFYGEKKMTTEEVLLVIVLFLSKGDMMAVA